MVVVVAAVAAAAVVVVWSPIDSRPDVCPTLAYEATLPGR